MLADPTYVLPPALSPHAASSNVNTESTTAVGPNLELGLPTHPPPGLPKPDDADRPELSSANWKSAEATLQRTLDSRLKEETRHTWPAGALSWPVHPSPEFPSGRLMPPMLNTPAEFGALPRMGVMQGWNPNLDHFLPPFKPMCLSTDAKEERYNLTPTRSRGWEHWVHPEHLDKPYLVAKKPGSWVEFEFETSLGVVKVYSLRSRTFGLGDLECWVDGDKDKARVIEGYWDKDE